MVIWISERKKVHGKQKIWINKNRLSFSFKFSKWILTIETKIITLCDVNINVCRKNILESYILSRERLRNWKWDRLVYFSKTGKNDISEQW